MHNPTAGWRLWTSILVLGGLLSFYLATPGKASGIQAGQCSPAKSTVQTGTTDHNIESGGLTRRYLLHIPATYDPAQQTPLVISVPALTSTAGLQLLISHFDRVSDRHGFIVAFPEGTGRPLHWNVIDVGQPNDIQFMRDMITELSNSLCIDPVRLYVNGFSDGAAMTYFMACRMNTQIAAVGLVSGADYFNLEDCKLAHSMPVIMFHGDADFVTKYTGQPLLGFPSIPVWIANWAALNGCDTPPVAMPATGDAHGIHYQNCKDSADVILFTISGGGHTWPGGMPTLLGKTSRDIDASEVMWQFFEAHPLSIGQ